MLSDNQIYIVKETLKEELNYLLSFDDIDDKLKEQIPVLMKTINQLEEEYSNRWKEHQRG